MPAPGPWPEPPERDELAACCRVVAEAHDADDPQQTAAALCDLYPHLSDRGWTPPPRASALLRLQAAAFDAAVVRLLAPQSGRT